MTAPLSPWPRLRDSWWVFALGCVAITIFPVSLVVELRCRRGHCGGAWWARVFELDALGSLPRLYTTTLFAAVAVLAAVAARRTARRSRLWWSVVAGIGVLLAVAKLVSIHSTAKEASPVATLVVGVAATGAALTWLAVTGRRWGVPGTRAIVLALALYALAALGLDLVTVAITDVQQRAGLISHAAAAFVEELGEALAALFLLVTVRWQLPVPGLSTRRSPG